MPDITMSLDDTLELDTIIKKTGVSESLKVTNGTEGSDFDTDGIQTQTDIFNPTNPGTYNIIANGQKISVKVTNPNSIPSSVLTEDLVAWYRFENGDARDYTAILNNNFADSTAYDGNINGTTVQPVGGITDFEYNEDSGLSSFNGSNDYISLPKFDYVNTGTSNEFTYTVWVNWNNLSSDSWIIGDEQSQNNGVMIQYKNDINEITNYNTSSYISTGYTPKTDSWEFYTMLQKSDGLYFSSNVNNLSKFSSHTNSDVSEFISIGAFGVATNSEGRYLDGKIDDIRIYNKALTQSEVTDIYNETKP